MQELCGLWSTFSGSELMGIIPQTSRGLSDSFFFVCRSHGRSGKIYFSLTLSALIWLALQKWHTMTFVQMQEVSCNAGNRRTSLAQDRMQLCWYRMAILHGHFIVLPLVQLPREWCHGLLPPARTSPRITERQRHTCLGRDLGKYPLFMKTECCTSD